nr:MAG TPA: hypothetical protein [Crassvirales sp.]
MQARWLDAPTHKFRIRFGLTVLMRGRLLFQQTSIIYPIYK